MRFPDFGIDCADTLADLSGDAASSLAEANGGQLSVLFQAPGSVVFDDGLVSTNPAALVAAADLERLAITGGSYGSEITISAVTYRILSIVPDGAGFAALDLERLS